jgi:hypothetical protein
VSVAPRCLVEPDEHRDQVRLVPAGPPAMVSEETNVVTTPKPHRTGLTISPWKSTLALPSASRARNLGSECV